MSKNGIQCWWCSWWWWWWHRERDGCRVGRGSSGQVLLRGRCPLQNHKLMVWFPPPTSQGPPVCEASHARMSPPAPTAVCTSRGHSGGHKGTVSRDPGVAVRSGGCESGKKPLASGCVPCPVPSVLTLPAQCQILSAERWTVLHLNG